MLVPDGKRVRQASFDGTRGISLLVVVGTGRFRRPPLNKREICEAVGACQVQKAQHHLAVDVRVEGWVLCTSRHESSVFDHPKFWKCVMRAMDRLQTVK